MVSPAATKITSQNFVLISRGTAEKKLQIVVSKHVAPKAVDRNRIKRLIKEALRQTKVDGSLKIIVKKNVSDAKMAEIKKQLNTLI